MIGYDYSNVTDIVLPLCICYLVNAPAVYTMYFPFVGEYLYT